MKQSHIGTSNSRHPPNGVRMHTGMIYSNLFLFFQLSFEVISYEKNIRCNHLMFSDIGEVIAKLKTWECHARWDYERKLITFLLVPF